MFCWKEWTKFIFTNGLENAYKSGTDYMPIMQYLMYLFGHIQGSIENIEKNINQIKTIPLIFEFIGGIFLLEIIKLKIHNRSEKTFFYSLLYFLNISIFYNSLFWGQVDGILATLIFISVFFAIRKKTLASCIFLILAINFKLQAIIFIPLVGLLVFPFLIRLRPQQLMLGTMIILLLQFLILLPFMLSGDLTLLWKATRDSFTKYPVISLNSGGIWNLLIKGNLWEIPDSTMIMGITYKSLGLILFFSLSLLALLPLISWNWRVLKTNNKTSLQHEKIFIISALIPLLFCYLNTEMHERYLHPSLIFLVTYSIISNKFWATGIICLGYLINLEHAIQFLHLKSYGTVIFNRTFLALLYLMGILLLFKDLFEIKFHDLKKIRSK
jgi:Gpi18-like mannosyltransferase